MAELSLSSACLDENLALELIDGSLSSGARGRVERHLEECDACRELVAELAHIAGAASGEVEAGAHSDVHERGADTVRTPFSEIRQLGAGASAGPYRVERVVGGGSCGTVYRAIDTRNGSVVALKHVTEAGLRSRFLREAETLRRLSHPAIVRYIDHGQSPDGTMYLVMEWLEGEDLDHAMRRDLGMLVTAGRGGASGFSGITSRRIEWQNVRALGQRLSSALAHAHALGCVHRDLSPKNVFLPGGRFDQAKLLDFGLVRIPTTITAERTTSQAVLGTPFYMAPEQVRDPKSVDARADLFGLGVLLFEMLAGRRPFEGEDLFTVWVKIVDHPTPDLRQFAPETPPPLVSLIEGLLAKDPLTRPPSARDVEIALARLEHTGERQQTFRLPNQPGAEPPPAFTPPPPPYPSSRDHVATGAVTYPPMSPRTAPMMAPLNTTHSRATPPPSAPSKRPSGAFVAASVGVGVTAIVATTALAVVHRGGGVGGAPSSQVEPSPNDAKGSADASAPLPAAAAVSTSEKAAKAQPAKVPISPTVKKPENPPDEELLLSESIHCGGEQAVTHRHAHLRPDPKMNGLGEAVSAGGECHVTLEDCVLEGPRSIIALNKAVVTLRRCKVLGTVELIGAPTLHLYDTALPHSPKITGTGRVIKH